MDFQKGLVNNICMRENDLRRYQVLLEMTPDRITCELCKRFEVHLFPSNVLYDFEAIAHVRFRHLDQFFMEPSDFYDAL
jgi:hypothetical protein